MQFAEIVVQFPEIDMQFAETCENDSYTVC